MQIFLTIVTTLAYGAWTWWFGKAMIGAKEWPDLAVSLVLLLISFVYATVFIWNMQDFFPSQVFDELFRPLIEVVYGNWL